MHSFHHSRGRILFEVFCALAISASCVGAWLQTDASALLMAASVAALYGLWHLTDIRRPKRATALAMSGPAPDAEDQSDLLEYLETVEAEPVAVTATGPKAVDGQPNKAPPTKRRRRKKQAAAVEARGPANVEPQADAAIVELPEPAEGVEEHAPIVPLFEAQPIVRQQRPVFGRKAG